MPELKMKPTYKIFLLDSNEYDELHKYIPEMKKEDLEGSFGFAVTKTKEAYVRRTAYSEWDEATIIHEAEELLAKHSEHEIDGIRWKKGKEIFASIIPVVASLIAGPLGPVVAGLVGAGTSALTQKTMTDEGKIGILPTVLSGVGGALGAGAMAPGVAASKAAGGGYLGQVLSGAQQAITGTSGALKSLQATPILGQTMGTIGNVPVSGTLGGISAALPASMGTPTGIGTLGASALPSLLGGISQVTTPAISTTPAITPSTFGIGTTAGQVAPAITPTTTAPIAAAPKTLIEQAKGLVNVPNILGAGSLLASMAPKTPEFQMPSQFTELQNKLMAGEALSPLGQQAQMELGNILKATPTELMPTANDAYYEAALRRTRESYAEAGRQLDAAYNVAGVYGSGEHLAQKAKLQEELARTESALYAETEQRRFELATNAKYQAIQQALGVDQAVMQDLLGLTGLSTQTAAAMYNAQAADVEEIRKALGTLGSELLIRGTTGQMKSGSGITINLGGK